MCRRLSRKGLGRKGLGRKELGRKELGRKELGRKGLGRRWGQLDKLRHFGFGLYNWAPVGQKGVQT